VCLSSKDEDELFELLSRGWDQRFDFDDLKKLEAFVRKHGEPARQLLIQFTSLHAELGSLIASSRAYEYAIAAINSQSNDLADGDDAVRPAVTQATSETRRRRLLTNRWAKWFVAAVLLLSVGAHFWLISSPKDSSPNTPVRQASLVRPPQPVATVTSVTNATWSSGDVHKIGDTLNERQQLELLTGIAQISMACGADVVLQAPCTVVLATDHLVVLKNGKLTAQAAKWATGFVVETNGLRITDLGTRFAVSADSSGVSEAHVLSGSVLAEAMNSQRPKRSSMLLTSGQAIRVSVPQSTIDLIAAQREEFIDNLKVFRPLRPIEIWNTGAGQAIGKTDPRWQITSGYADYGPYPKPAIITPGDPSYLDNMPDASQWISLDDKVQPGIRPETLHTFETTFDLTGYDLETVHIVGLFLVDDAINELRINGHPVAYERWVTTWNVYDFKSFHPITIVDGFVPGKNVISIDVYNSPSHPDHPMHPNPMGLRVEWQAFGCEAR
jgi:ferric-dicitrate binding protein FerR (iron transport regulator)